ncbi:Dfp1/Him1, central region-domain-containing protein [Multifurca ochricompacta]|uniref:Dfp1/Him1, central region-domain-containing protein n=1 Tax=Multifurca ochricompacta TaxID=376703 RepID=A0AAD4M8P0_9AGAM|nr:Dfp1/Him1, central region-domain-containing protein [Multifurca ochricompacta]
MATLTRRPLEGNRRSLPQLIPNGSPLPRLSTRSLSSTAKRPRSPDTFLDSQQSLNAKRPKPVPPSPTVTPALQEEESKLKERKRAEREAQKEEFRIKYTRAFPKFSFHLHWDVSEGDPDARERLQARINYLDARVEDFFSKDNITHFITNLPIPQDDIVANNNKENVLASTSRTPNTLKSPIRLKSRHVEDLPIANDNRLLLKAVEWKMKIWTVAKLESVLDRCQAPVSPELSRAGTTASAPQTLSRLLQSERLHGTTERDPNEKRLGFHYFSKTSYFILVEDLNEEIATVHAMEYPIKKGRDGKETGDWPVLYCHPRARGPFIEFDKNEARRLNAREQERVQRAMKLREQEMQRKMRADRLQAKKAGDLRRSVSMVNLHRKISVGEDSRPPQDFVDLDAEGGDLFESANASGYLASGYTAASGNSMAITSTTGTTSTSGLSVRGAMQMPSALRERLQQQIVTSRKVGLGNNMGQKEREKEHKGNMGPPSAIPERKALRKSKSTNTMRLPKREETTKPGYCECCRMKFDDFQKHIIHRKHRKYATNPDNFIQLDYLLERIRRQTRAEVAEGRSRSLAARRPDSHKATPEDSACFDTYIQVPDGDAQRFSSSQEVSDYLPQPYKGAVWDELDEPGVDGDGSGEKIGNSMDI